MNTNNDGEGGETMSTGNVMDGFSETGNHNRNSNISYNNNMDNDNDNLDTFADVPLPPPPNALPPAPIVEPTPMGNDYNDDYLDDDDRNDDEDMYNETAGND
eukprot:CAMPEP_0114655902 /NCGR_PEP_ID=MMETSP0191-20121206/11574_1 /TAXON_ID=126664 /ORGANISM="Sorites sp." /LENGTH=101 /DNA_ID=CAMNT_0001872113 /DNA_START=2345 /DNA_END=2650 /DNA_ORIENTATION=+